jgi:hypothetical protein
MGANSCAVTGAPVRVDPLRLLIGFRAPWVGLSPSGPSLVSLRSRVLDRFFAIFMELL